MDVQPTDHISGENKQHLLEANVHVSPTHLDNELDNSKQLDLAEDPIVVSHLNVDHT